MKPESMLDVRYKYMWAFHIAFNTGFSAYTMSLNEAHKRYSPTDTVFFDILDKEIRYADLTIEEQAQLEKVLIDYGVTYVPKVGDRIRIHIDGYRQRTPLWAEGHCGTVVKLNPKTVGVKLDAYPYEIQKIDYGDYDFLGA